MATSIWDRILPWRRARLAAALPAPEPASMGIGTHPPERLFSREVIAPALVPPRRGRRAGRRSDASGWAAHWDSLVNTLSGLGGQYDKGTQGRPDTMRMPLDVVELAALYRYNGYARRFVDIVPNDATRKGWKVNDSSQTVDVMKAETDRLKIVSKVREAWTWGRLYGGGGLFLVLDEDVPPEYADRPVAWLERPIDYARVRGLLNLVVFDSSTGRPYSYEGDPRSPMFGEPLKWLVTPQTNAASSLLTSAVVHHSRIIYFPGARLPVSIRNANGGIDDSILEAVWDAIRHKTSIDQAAANIAQELKINVLKIKGLAELKTGDAATAFDTRIAALAKSKSLLNMVITDEEESFDSLTTSVSGFDMLDKNASSAYAAVSGMPDTLLFGNAPSGLSSDGASQRNNWSNVIASSQENWLRDPLTRIYTVLYRASEGPTQGMEPDEWSVVFLPLDELTEKEQADLEKAHADADAVRVQAGILPAEHIAKSRYGPSGYSNEILPYDPAAEDAAALAAAEAKLRGLEVAGGDVPLGGTGGTQVPAVDADAPLTDEAVGALADKMTAHHVERCPHGALNRCRLCGIERVRDFDVGPDGEPVWKVIWRPIYAIVANDPTVLPAGAPPPVVVPAANV